MPINVKYPHCGIANMNIRSSEKTTETSYSVGVYFECHTFEQKNVGNKDRVLYISKKIA